MTRIRPALVIIAAATTPDERGAPAAARAQCALEEQPRGRSRADGTSKALPACGGTDYIEHTKQEQRTSDEMTGFSAL